MAAKIIRKEGKKLIIELTIDLQDSMLDSEEEIQAVVNEAGSLATEEALKQFDTQGEAIEIEGKQWRSKGREQKFYQTPYGVVSVRDMFITTTDEEKRSALWSKPRALLAVQRPGLPSRLALKWRVTQHATSNRISWNAKEEKCRHRFCKTYHKKWRA
jgi:hypothetical protein